jgi:hypothetical protein
MMTETERLAFTYDRCEATVEEVVASATAGAKAAAKAAVGLPADQYLRRDDGADGDRRRDPAQR